MDDNSNKNHTYESCGENDTLLQDDNRETIERDPQIRTSFPCEGSPCLSKLLACLCLPITVLSCCGMFQLSEKEHAAVLYFGKYVGSVEEPGIHFLLPFGCEQRTMSTAIRTMDMKHLKVLDLRGNPVAVSAVVTFVPTSARKARVDVVNPWPNASWDQGRSEKTYLQLQAEAVLKTVASQFPYDAPPGCPSLRTEGNHITEMLTKSLQTRVAVTGAKIMSFDLTDLSYAPEIAAHMLVRQQAAALVDARKIIVEAAVDMTHSAIESLEAKGRDLDEDTKSSICSNLLTVICSHEAVTPVVNMDR